MKYHLLIFCSQFRPEMLDTLYSFAKFQYECGNYSGAADYLYLHRGLVPISDKVVLFILLNCIPID